MKWIIHLTLCLTIITIHGDVCFGIPGDKGLILGLWNNASIITTIGIPRTSAINLAYTYFVYTNTKLQLTSITSDPDKNIIFLNFGSSIYAYENFNIRQDLQHEHRLKYQGKFSSLGQIAFDYVSNNLYWCDESLHWIAMKPAYISNTTMYKVVVDEDVNHPEGIALDPEDGVMFFSDNGPNPRIEQASMDGSDRTVIVHSGLLLVRALSVDTVSNILYWADSWKNTLEACNYDGLSRRTVIKTFFSATGIHYYQNVLHIVSSDNNMMGGYHATSGLLVYHKKIDQGDPYAVHVYDAETLISYNDPCSSRGCQYMCVNTPTGPTCLCAEGSLLSTDNLTCIGRFRLHEKGFIVNNETSFSMLEMSSFNGGGGFYPSTQVPPIIESFTVDANLDLIYFVDGRDNTLKEFNILTTQLRKLSYIPYAKALIFDWIANLLGWIEPTQSNIRAFSITSGKMSTIYSGLQEPSSLTVDAHNSYLFWISGSSEKSIMRGTWNKDSPQVILSSATLNNPSSLYYDVTSNRIYWLQDRYIASSMTNGFDAQYHLTTNGATQALVYKGFFVWINGNKMYVARKDTMHEEYSVDIVENSKGVAIFDPSLQQDRRGTCHILNGGCEDICVPTQRGRRCECDLGLEIKSDNTTCDSVVFSTNFIVIGDMMHGRILQVDIDTGHLVKLPIYPTVSFGIMFDKSRMELLYCEFSTKAIMSTTLDGKNSALVYATGSAYPIAIAIDYSTGNIYYTADGMHPSQGYVGVVHRINLLHKTLFSNLYYPSNIVVYPSKGFFYWIEHGNIPHISRAYMDGTSKTYIATTDIGSPSGLAIDYTSKRLYWTDQRNNRIEYSDLNGGNRRILTTDDYAYLMDIVIHGQYLYYTAYTRQRITKMDKATGLKVTFMSKHPELGILWNLAIYADDEVDVSTYCSTLNGNCSTFCFPTPSGRTCGCQDNVDLQSDHTTCQGVTRCNTSQQNVNVLNCSPYSGQTCEIECKAGWKLAVNMSITCGPSGQWSPPTADLCTEISCPLKIKNGHVSSLCQGRTGEHCDVTCHKGFTASFSEIICTLSGAWDRNSDDICAESYEEKNLASIGIWLSTSVVVIAITIVAIVCIVRRRKPPGNECEEPRVENPHSTFINGGYLTGVESYSTSQETPTSCMYNSIDDSHFTQYDEGVIDTHL